ncbi:MAG: NAD(P)/FAD-dependent oxidoreductase [Deltaproteobacteria bacterium]|nr:NAD(P)/FAD-dependent oxidoreductase [Deltaproteobacteria bacterium]MBW2171381.1 NAD(P)/FAD-dependent oxidoreductase [Deltaproteobacteria bacterium]
MPKKWDVIVIGAGVGGLTAAATLVKTGLQVLVLEKSLHPGGTAYTYSRTGFTFPMGPLGFSTPGLVRDTLADLGQDHDLHFHRVHYKVLAFGVSVVLSLPFDQVKAEMTQCFPADSKGLKQFFHDMDKILSAMGSDKETHRSFLEEAGEKSANEYLRGLITDQRLRRILGSLGTRDAYTSLPLLAAQWNLMCNQGIWYPKGGMRSFCQRLARAVTSNSTGNPGRGEIRLGAGVKEIRVLDGRASGVTLGDGTGIDARGVISNADYKTTFMKLVKAEGTPDSWYRAIANAKQSGSIFQVCLGVEATGVDLSAFSDASRLIYRRHTSGVAQREDVPDWQSAEVNPEAIAGQDMEVSLWSHADPGLAPEGGVVIVIRAEADHAHFSRYRPAEGQRNGAYQDYKMRLGRALIQETASLLPGLEGAVVVMDVATPLTFEERGGRSQGAVAGWSWDYKDNPSHEPLELVQTPIHGLYMAGYQAYSALFMGGLPMAMASGRAAAEAFLQGTGPVHEVRIPGAVGPDISVN